MLYFYTYEGVVKALEKVSFKIERGDTLGLVGETGCGKSVTSLSIIRLVPPPGKIEEGEVIFNLAKGRKSRYINLLNQSEAFMQAIRGNEISMIFQEPSSALNPVYTIGDQIAESFLFHREKELLREALVKIFSFLPFIKSKEKIIKRIAIQKSVNLLRRMGIPNPEKVVERYPHQLSGGMQQRVVIAIALACHPKLLIADEPTSNLDVTIQAQILDLIRSLKEELNTSVLFISHDLGVVAEMCKWIAVMYAGNICELTKMEELFENPLHPYTEALLKSIPRRGTRKLESIKGSVPNLVNPPSGCRFHPRCPKAKEKCTKERPEIREVYKDHFVACHFYKD